MEIAIWYFLIGAGIGCFYSLTLAADKEDAMAGGITLVFLWPVAVSLAPFALIFGCLYKWRRT